MSREIFLISIIESEEEWLRCVCGMNWPNPEKVASLVLGMWASRPLENPWAVSSDRTHVYINKLGMERYDFPEGAIDCKIIHETVEAELCLEGSTLIDAHLVASRAELRKARESGILLSYFVAEMRSCLLTGQFKEVGRKTRAYLEVRKE